MRKTIHTLYALLALVAVAALAACSSDDSYEWAKKVSDGNPGAYFPASNKASELLTPDENDSRQGIRLTVVRTNTQGDLTVPVIVDHADSVFTVPATAVFKDGEAETTIEVGCKGLQPRTTYRFTIHLDEAYTNPYARTDGSPVFNYDVLVAQWTKVVDNAQFLWNKSEFATSTSSIYWLEGQNRFRIDNWLGSGINLQFQIVAQDKENTAFYSLDNFDANDRSTWHGAFQPYDHSLMDPYGGSYWYLMNDPETEDYASWYPDGEGKLGISYVNFYYEATSENYSSVDMRGSTTGYSLFLVPYVYYTDGTQSGYTYLYGYWSGLNAAK